MLGNLLAEVALDDVTKLDPQDSDCACPMIVPGADPHEAPSEEKEALLVKKVTAFLNRILHEDFLREMPPEIKCAAH